MDVVLFDPSNPSWSAEIDRIGAILGAPDNPTIFPYHFLQVVLPRLGGGIISVARNRTCMGIGFVFPRGYNRQPTGKSDVGSGRTQQVYTLRYHSIPRERQLDNDLANEVIRRVEPLLDGSKIVLYDPYARHDYQATSQMIDDISIGRPNEREAGEIRTLHAQIWGSPPEFLYPVDIHSMNFRLGTSLVARIDGELAGFLIGFYRFNGPELPHDWQARFQDALRLESQIMGVLPKYRGLHIGSLLKKAQAEATRNEGIAVVSWTADPLQYPNASLNFGLLRAVSFDFQTNYYPFRNDLNRVSASRLNLVWLVGTKRVEDVPQRGSRGLALDLTAHPEIQVVNQGYSRINYSADRPVIAIEIPANWTRLQSESISEAQRWRANTDKIFEHYVGSRQNQYAITGVGAAFDRRYLIGQQVNDALLRHLGHVSDCRH